MPCVSFPARDSPLNFKRTRLYFGCKSNNSYFRFYKLYYNFYYFTICVPHCKAFPLHFTHYSQVHHTSPTLLRDKSYIPQNVPFSSSISSNLPTAGGIIRPYKGAYTEKRLKMHGILFRLHHLPTNRKRAIAVLTATIYHRKVVVSSSLRSMFETKAFLRDPSAALSET